MSSLAVWQWLTACLTEGANGWLSHAADPTLQGVLLHLELTVFKTKVRATKCFSPVSHQKWDCHHGFTIPITTPGQSLVPFLCSYCAHLFLPQSGAGMWLRDRVLPGRHEVLHWVPALRAKGFSNGSSCLSTHRCHVAAQEND